MSASEASISEAPEATAGAALFNEKSFYLEEFYGKSLLFALVPPSGERLGELDSLARTLRELRRNQTRGIVIASRNALGRVMRRLGRLAPAGEPPVFNPAAGLRSRPYPPDSAVARIWQGLRTGSIVVGAADTNDPIDLTVFAQELASRLRVFKLILLDRQGGLTGRDGRRLSFVELGRIAHALRADRGRLRRAELRAVARALGDGVGSVNLAAPRGVYEELFSFVGTGTLFTERRYGFVRPISIDDFGEVQALIERGQSEGYLLPRSREEIAQLLPSCFGYRVGDEHLAGVCSLLTEPYRRERAGELTALYTLTRFAGEGVAAELVKEVLNEARARPLRYVFACTAQERAASFFTRLKFRRVSPKDVPLAKWRGYDRARMARLFIFRYDLA
ncbi:MAG TPA: GNAT family N-acetyltransferase [Candidatus Binataceae bacterium]|nr:GNAT family N-acetyltransferase [Candidatus Binataceae bacterium]